MWYKPSKELTIEKVHEDLQNLQDDRFFKQMSQKEGQLMVGGDTYAMAFKAFNWRVMKHLKMDMVEVHDAFHAAMFVFGFQVLMITFIGYIIMGDSFHITMPNSVQVMGARFVCSILMHLQVEGDVRQGLRMMKYVVNHPFDFSNPGSAFFVAVMQIFGGLFAEIACILYLSSIDTAIDIIIKFVALASIAKVDDFYASALPAEAYKIKGATPPLKIRVNRRDWAAFKIANKRKAQAEANGEKLAEGCEELKVLEKNAIMNDYGISRKVGRFIFKTLRIIYASYIFYFLPYTALWISYVVNLGAAAE